MSVAKKKKLLLSIKKKINLKMSMKRTTKIVEMNSLMGIKTHRST